MRFSLCYSISMKVNQGTFNTEDLLKQALRDEEVIVTVYSGGENNEDIIGFLAELDSQQMRESIRSQALNSLGVSQETLDFFSSATDEEKEQLKNLALISYHKKELANLEAKIQ